MFIKEKLKAPWRITFDTNPDQCNLHCMMCEEHSKYNFNKHKDFRIMEFKTIKEVVQDLVNYGLKEIIPSTMGEPLLYDNFIDLIKLVKSYNLKMNLTTNGTFPRLGAEKWGKLILPIASDIKISINGASKCINEQIMEGMNFEKQISNIKKFIKIRDDIRQKGIEYPTITFQATFMEKNLDEILGLLKLAIELNIDRFKGHHLWITHPELENQSLLKDKESIKKWNTTVEKMKIIADTTILKNGNKIKLDNIYSISNNSKNKIIPENFICPFLGREAWIAWDGTFNVCCAPDYLRRTLGYFGTVKEMNFIELWNSNSYRHLINNWGTYQVCKECNMRRPLKNLGECLNE